MTTDSRTKLHFYTRTNRILEPSLSPRAHLLPRRVFESDADLLALYERFVTLKENQTKHQTLAGKARLAAESARTVHAAKRRELLATGGDLSKLSDTSAKHLEEAETHTAHAKAAEGALLGVARELAYKLAEVAPHLLDPSEERIKTAAAVMDDAIDALEGAWIDYERAWRERRILGQAALFAGPIVNYDDSATLPPAVAEAVSTLRSHLTNLDRLKADEAAIRAERDRGDQP